MDHLKRSDFNKRVTIKVVDKTKDASTGHGEAYTTLLSTWAAVDSKGGNRTFSDGMMIVFDRKDFYITYRSALNVVNADSIFEYEGRQYKYQVESFVDEKKHIIKYETLGL